MKESQQLALVILFLAVPFLAMAAYFFVFHFLLMAPQSTEPDYYAVYEIENQLYYGGPCRGLSLGTIQEGLVECRDGPLPVLVNKLNGTVLDVHRPWDIQKRWLPSGERVFVDYNNGYIFWAEGGKVTNFVKLDSKPEAQLICYPPEPAEGVSVSGDHENQDEGKKSVQHENSGESVQGARARDDDVGTAYTPTAKRK